MAVRDDLGRPELAVTELQTAIDSILAPRMRYPDWVENHGLPEDQSGFMADPDDDGSANYLEFAFGTDPTNARFHHRPNIQRSDEGITLEYRISRAVSGLEIEIDRSTNMETWLPFTPTENQLRVGTFPGFEIRRIELPQTETGSEYFRFRITIQTDQ